MHMHICMQRPRAVQKKNVSSKKNVTRLINNEISRVYARVRARALARVFTYIYVRIHVHALTRTRVRVQYAPK